MDYQYGFNGQEKSAEINKNSYTAEYWEYDSRTGRRWNIDPIAKGQESPYSALSNSPLVLIDPNGADTIRVTKRTVITRLKGQTDNHSDNLAVRDKTITNIKYSISTVTKEGEDVFVYDDVVEDGRVTTTKTTVLHPEDPESAMGVTKGKNIYFDGLWTTERNNKDWESVGKFMNLDRSFYDYMITRNPKSEYWRSRALSIAMMEGVMPAFTKAMMLTWIGFRFSGLNATEQELVYDPRVRQRALEDPRSHNFPYSFDKYILETRPILKNNGYKIYQLPGTMHGNIKNGIQEIKSGVFEVGVTKDGIIDHRFFRSY